MATLALCIGTGFLSPFNHLTRTYIPSVIPILIENAACRLLACSLLIPSSHMLATLSCHTQLLLSVRSHAPGWLTRCSAAPFQEVLRFSRAGVPCPGASLQRVSRSCLYPPWPSWLQQPVCTAAMPQANRGMPACVCS